MRFRTVLVVLGLSRFRVVRRWAGGRWDLFHNRMSGRTMWIADVGYLPYSGAYHWHTLDSELYDMPATKAVKS